MRKQVEEYLKAQESSNFPGYVHALVVELGTSTRTAEVRQAAGLALKNTMVARDEVAAKLLSQRWQSVPAAARTQVKTMLLQILRDPLKTIRSTATLVSTHIAHVQLWLRSPLPLSLWMA